VGVNRCGLWKPWMQAKPLRIWQSAEPEVPFGAARLDHASGLTARAKSIGIPCQSQTCRVSCSAVLAQVPTVQSEPASPGSVKMNARSDGVSAWFPWPHCWLCLPMRVAPRLGPMLFAGRTETELTPIRSCINKARRFHQIQGRSCRAQRWCTVARSESWPAVRGHSPWGSCRENMSWTCLNSFLVLLKRCRPSSARRPCDQNV
jgi:hypothetical protein